MVWDKLARKYDRLWVQKYSLAPTRKAVAEIVINKYAIKNLIDIGCGTGQLLLELHEKRKDLILYGIDKSEQMIACAKEKNTGAALFCVDITDHNISEFLEGGMDMAVCCHSFPYYKSKPEVVSTIYHLLKDGGYVIFVQASVNNLYDKIVMSIVERTAEKAEYLSKKDFIAMVADKFQIKTEFRIHEKWFMPSICGFVLKKI